MGKKWLEKLSMILLLGWNSGLVESNEGITLLNLLSISTIWSLMRPCCCLVKELSNREWGRDRLSDLLSINNLRMWLTGRVKNFKSII